MDGTEYQPRSSKPTHTVSWFYLEFEDWFVVIGLAAVTNVFGRWIDRNIFGIPMNVFLQYIVSCSSAVLDVFKYGKPRGYLKDLLAWHAKPRIYCGMEPDSQVNLDYPAEVITMQPTPADQVLSVGSTATFTVTASGAPVELPVATQRDKPGGRCKSGRWRHHQRLDHLYADHQQCADER